VSETKKVLIVDDSAFIRKILEEMISGFTGFKVVGVAGDPYIAANKIVRLGPDIITLDIEMPVMDGLTFLEKLMNTRPMPVIIVSSHIHEDDNSLKALELGAVEYVRKPSYFEEDGLVTFKSEIREKLDIAAQSKAGLIKYSKMEIEEKYSVDDVIVNEKPGKSRITSGNIIALGASTGGTNALPVILEKLPSKIPGIVMVQHMPAGFTESFAKRLNNTCALHVKEAEDGEPVTPGKAILAPGKTHMMVVRKGAELRVEIRDGKPVNRHKPSIDVLFRSVVQSAGAKAVGVLLTGMGVDGAQGLLDMKNAGCATIVQSKETSLVFGMPKAAIDKGAANKIINLDDISAHLLKYKI